MKISPVVVFAVGLFPAAAAVVVVNAMLLHSYPSRGCHNKRVPIHGAHRQHHDSPSLAVDDPGPLPKPTQTLSMQDDESSRGGHAISRAILLRAAAVSNLLSFHLFPLEAHGTTRDPQTGILQPDPGEIEASIPVDWSGVENPVSSSSSDPKLLFGRLDARPDSIFYRDPRFVEHVDDNAVRLLTEYVSTTAIRPGDRAVLDLCSSWTSHIHPTVASRLSRVSGLGMNAQELERNAALTDWTVRDLNEDPRLIGYEDGSFDVVLCQLSIDYLTKPLDVLREVGRVLVPGGRVHVLFSNRLFLSKAVGLWAGGDDIDHAYYVGCYLHFCNGGFKEIKGQDLSTRRRGRVIGDPLFVVTAVKS
jgi:SAM-dependent methyltransferase